MLALDEWNLMDVLGINKSYLKQKAYLHELGRLPWESEVNDVKRRFH